VNAFVSTLIKYWKEILIGLLLLTVSASWYYDRSSLIKAMDIATARYEDELVILKESHARETERKAELVEEYEEKIKRLLSEYEKTQEEVEELKSRRVEEVTRLRTTNPAALIEQIEEAFEFIYVE
jgi:Txe/YoeB family toxin of Txe-Axe toxin-antitoxin module